MLELEGHVLNVVEAGHTDCAGSTFLHVPSVGLVVVGDTVYNDTHIFLGDSDARARNLWRAALDAIAALAPAGSHPDCQPGTGVTAGISGAN